VALVRWSLLDDDSRGSGPWRTLIPTVLHSSDTMQRPPLPGVIFCHTTTSANQDLLTDWRLSGCGEQWRQRVVDGASGHCCVWAWVRAFSIDRAFFESLCTGGHGSEVTDAELLQVVVGASSALWVQEIGVQNGREAGGPGALVDELEQDKARSYKEQFKSHFNQNSHQSLKDSDV
jgi:hypothetical protein